MKRFLFAAGLLLALSLPACQCDEKPPVGPVQPAAQAHAVPQTLA